MTSVVAVQSKFDNEVRSLLGGAAMPKVMAVGVSGGPDSMLLCYLMKSFCARHNIDLHALVVDHKLRAGSSVEAESTKAFLAEQGVKVAILAWEGDKPQSNIQAVARDKRYALIGDYCNEHGIDVLVMGHHKDDQAETVLLRIMRGSGVDGIGGMDGYTVHNGLVVLRPMLANSRNEIMQCMDEIGWEYCVDPSNENEIFSRVRVRRLLSSESWSFLKDKLILLAYNARRAGDYLQQQTNFFLDNHCVFCQFGTASIELGVYKQQHEEIALRALSAMLMRIGGNSSSPRLLQLERVHHALHGEKWKDSTLWGCFLKVRRGKLIIMREESDIPEFTDVMAGQKFCWDKRFVVDSKMDGYIKPISRHRYHKELGPLLPADIDHASIGVIATLPAFFDVNDNLVMVPGVYEASGYNGRISIQLRQR